LARPLARRDRADPDHELGRRNRVEFQVSSGRSSINRAFDVRHRSAPGCDERPVDSNGPAVDFNRSNSAGRENGSAAILRGCKGQTMNPSRLTGRSAPEPRFGPGIRKVVADFGFQTAQVGRPKTRLAVSCQSKPSGGAKPTLEQGLTRGRKPPGLTAIGN